MLARVGVLVDEEEVYLAVRVEDHGVGVLVDEELFLVVRQDKPPPPLARLCPPRYFKQQEITLFRQAEAEAGADTGRPVSHTIPRLMSPVSTSSRSVAAAAAAAATTAAAAAAAPPVASLPSSAVSNPSEPLSDLLASAPVPATASQGWDASGPLGAAAAVVPQQAQPPLTPPTQTPLPAAAPSAPTHPPPAPPAAAPPVPAPPAAAPPAPTPPVAAPPAPTPPAPTPLAAAPPAAKEEEPVASVSLPSAGTGATSAPLVQPAPHTEDGSEAGGDVGTGAVAAKSEALAGAADAGSPPGLVFGDEVSGE